MPTPAPARTVDITAAPRVVITLASGLVTRVFGELMPSARDNAWQAVCADRARAAQREELASVLREALGRGPVETGIVRDAGRLGAGSTVGSGAGHRHDA